MVLEIGVRRGGSLDIWKKYFGSDSKIVGLDIDPLCQSMRARGFDIHIGDQSDENFLKSVLDGHQKFDVVIDDGSHIGSHMIKSFEFIYPRMSENGIYIVEDVVPSVIASKSSGGKHPSFVDYACGLSAQLNYGFTSQSVLDRVNNNSRQASARGRKNVDIFYSGSIGEFQAPSLFTAITKSIVFYPNMVVFEKSPQSNRCSIKTGKMVPGQLEIFSAYKAVAPTES